MNFSSQIKEEIISKKPKELLAKKSFLTGIIRGNGVLFEDENGLNVEFSMYNEQEAEIVVSILKSVYDYNVSELFVSSDHLNGKDRLFFKLYGDRAIEILTDLYILSNQDGYIDFNLKLGNSIKFDEDFCYFLRGLFLSCGSATIPKNNTEEKTKYHLELVFSHTTTAYEILERLAKSNINAKILRRKENVVIYIKSAEEIKNFLAFIKTPKTVLSLVDLIITRELTNNSNRVKNCDLGNVNRQIDASTKVLEAIEIIKSNGVYESLKEDLKNTVDYKLENPDDTLSELADRMGITKSCLNHRLRKIIQLSKNN